MRKEIVEELEKLWEEKPYLRFGQIIASLLGSDKAFEVGQDEWLKRIKEMRRN